MPKADKNLKKTEVVDNSNEVKNKFFTFDEIYKARTAMLLSIVTMLIVIVSIAIFTLFMKQTQSEILDRIKERDIMVLTSRGAILGKTSPVYNEVVKQFAITTFNSTLIYNPNNIKPQLNFMRVYSSPDIFKNYSEMVQSNVKTQNISKKVYYATLDTNKGVIVQDIVPNKRYRIILEGVRDIISNYKDNNQKYKFRLELIIDKNLNTNVENMYGLNIISYNFSKI